MSLYTINLKVLQLTNISRKLVRISSFQCFRQSIRKFLYRPPQSPIDNVKKKILKASITSAESVKNSKLVPEGYELIYISSAFRFTKIIYIFSAGSLLYSLYTFKFYFTDPEWLEKKLEIAFGTIKKNPHLSIALSLFSIISIIICKCHVQLIFRKENNFKSLTYGIFLNKKYIDHSLHECIAPNPKSYNIFFKLKNKKLIIYSDCFFTETDFYDMCTTTDYIY